MKIFFIFLLSSFIFSSEQVFVVCEGNYGSNNSSLWTINNEDVNEYYNNPLGDVAQSVLVNGNQLFVILNVSSNIQVFDITDDGLIPTHIIDTDLSGPREMLVYENYLYFTNWYTADIKKINLLTWQIESEISMPGLPEDIIYFDGFIYSSINMNIDWSDGSLVVKVDPSTNMIVHEYEVGLGPGNLLEHEGEIYIARTYYDENWNAFSGTSKISDNDDVLIVNYGGALPCGGSVLSYDGSVYRAYDGGIAMLDSNLEIMPDMRIGDYDYNSIYSVEIIGDYIYFGLTDYLTPDDVKVVDFNGDEIASYEVGVLPGDFAVWNSCNNNGDVSNDGIVNIIDIVGIVNAILDGENYNCTADLNLDDLVNILDVIQLVQEILEIDSFRGAANWVQKHFPQIKVNERIKKALRHSQ